VRVALALGFLVAASVRNRVRQQLRRLRRPRYLIAFLVGAGWFWMFVFRRMTFGDAGDLPGPGRELIVWAGAGLGVAGLLPMWIFGSARPALAFSEAEIQLLFPGPVSRRQLLAWKIVRNVLLVALSALLMTVIFGARVSGHAAFFFLAAWMGLSSWSLHGVGATLTRSRLLLRGRRGALLLGGGVLLVVAGFGALAAGVSSQLAPGGGPEAWADALERSPLRWILLPARAPLQAAFAQDLGSFVAPFAVSVTTLALHALWVLSGDVAFEEAAVVEAERRAKASEARRGRGAAALRSAKGSYRLGPGRPLWALAWKNVIAVRRVFAGRVTAALLPFVLLAFAAAFLVGTTMPELGVAGGMAVGAASLGALLVLLGPNALRTDFRMEYRNLDLLRSLPLSGVQVVVGQLVAPWALLGGLQLLLFTLALTLSQKLALFGLPVGLHAPLWLAAALVAPLLTAAGLVVQNAIVLLVPGWVGDAFEQARGVEALGQRLIGFIAGLLVLLTAVLPALGVAGVISLLTWPLLGGWSLPAGALGAASVLVLELALAVHLMGRRFDRLDVSSE
jgi:ABC-2 type transport system permease protein